MEISQTSNNNLTPPKISPLLTLPKELFKKIICEFLPLSDALKTRVLNKTFCQLIVEVKAQEERNFLKRLHTALLKSFLFLPTPLINDLEKIEISNNIEHRCTTLRDIHTYNKLWFYQIKGILKPLTPTPVVWQSIAEPMLEQLHLFPRLAVKCFTERIVEQGTPLFYRWRITPHSVEQKKFFHPSLIWNRESLVLTPLCLTLLSLDGDRFSLATRGALNEQYRHEWGDITISAIIVLKAAYNAPFAEELELAKKMHNIGRREAMYVAILNQVLTQRDYPLLYRLIEEVFEESLSPSTQTALIQILVTANPPKAIEKALTLQNQSVQRQAFIDIFPHLHSLLFQGEAATKPMFALMEKIKKEDRKNVAFEIMEMFQLIVEKDPTQGAKFWGAQSNPVIRAPENHRALFVTLMIVSLQARYQPDKLHACQRAYQILKNLNPPSSPLWHARCFFNSVNFSQNETEALTVLSYFFEIANSAILQQFLRLLFEAFPGVVHRSAPFFTKLDESIQKEEDRLWIEQQLYEHPLLTNPSPPVTSLMAWLHMVKRFCRNSDKKDETIASLLIKLQKQQPNSTLFFFNDPDKRSFFEEIKSEAKRLEVQTALAHEDSFKLMADTLCSLLKNRDPITPFFETHRTNITKEIKDRLLFANNNYTDLFLQEGLLTLHEATEWVKRSPHPIKGKIFFPIIRYFDSLIEKQALSIEDFAHFLEEIKDPALRDEGLTRIAFCLDEKRANLEIVKFFPLFANIQDESCKHIALVYVITCAFRAVQQEEKSAEIFLRALEQISDRFPILQLFIDGLKSSLLIYQGESYDSLPFSLQMGYIYRLCYTNMPQALDLAKNSSYKKEALLVLLKHLSYYNIESKEVFLESLLALQEAVPQEDRDHPPLLKLLDRLPLIMKSSRREEFLNNLFLAGKNINKIRLLFLLLTYEKRSSAIEIVQETLTFFPELQQRSPFRLTTAIFPREFFALENWVALGEEEGAALLDYTYTRDSEYALYFFTLSLLELKVGSNFSKSPLMIVKVAEWISKFKPYYGNALKKKLIEFLQTLPPEMREELKERSDCIRNLPLSPTL